MDDDKLNGKKRIGPYRTGKKESGQKPVFFATSVGNCTAGCPYTQYFDYPVSMINEAPSGRAKGDDPQFEVPLALRHLRDLHTRCPCEVDVTHIMDTLRIIARRGGQDIGEGRQALLRFIP